MALLTRIISQKSHKNKMRCIGLHIPKCAGTSLMTFVRQHMLDDQYYIFSSFNQNIQSSRLDFFDILNKDRLLFVFGHSMNEYMCKTLHNQPAFLFTGLRDPRKAIISDYLYHIKTMRSAKTRELNVKDFLELRANFISRTLTNKFPTASRLSGESTLANQAYATLSLFDHIYDSETINKTAAPILQKLGLPKGMDVHDNAKSATLNQEPKIRDAIEKLKSIMHKHISSDIELYERYTSERHIDKSGTCHVPNNNRYLTKNDLFDKLPDEEECERRTREILINALAYETKLLNTIDEVKSIMTQRIKNAERVLHSLK